MMVVREVEPHPDPTQCRPKCIVINFYQYKKKKYWHKCRPWMVTLLLPPLNQIYMHACNFQLMRKTLHGNLVSLGVIWAKWPIYFDAKLK